MVNEGKEKKMPVVFGCDADEGGDVGYGYEGFLEGW